MIKFLFNTIIYTFTRFQPHEKGIKEEINKKFAIEEIFKSKEGIQEMQKSKCLQLFGKVVFAERKKSLPGYFHAHQ